MSGLDNKLVEEVRKTCLKYGYEVEDIPFVRKGDILMLMPILHDVSHDQLLADTFEALSKSMGLEEVSVGCTVVISASKRGTLLGVDPLAITAPVVIRDDEGQKLYLTVETFLQLEHAEEVE
ncbi:hypothetical protein [Neptuniibacter sp. QD37_11]|uniref:hypothetical protein n=1 Tax=Neptuniibacter sp. QD37_11 TaxID=3398209 RepID=UPI0039F5DCEC